MKVTIIDSLKLKDVEHLGEFASELLIPDQIFLAEYAGKDNVEVRLTYLDGSCEWYVPFSWCEPVADGITDEEVEALNSVARKIHGYAKDKGWWVEEQNNLDSLEKLIASEMEIEKGTLAILMKKIKERELIKKRSPLELQMLCVSELAEATEESRNDMPAIYQRQKAKPNGDYIIKEDEEGWNKNAKPEGVAVELMDCVIRIADIFGETGWNFGDVLRLKFDYNTTRSHRHGGKKY